MNWSYGLASVFVRASIMEPWGLVVSDATVAGLLVIVTDDTGSSEAVQDSLNRFIISNRDIDMLQEKLLYLYRHPEQLTAMGLVAQQAVHNFTWERCGQRLLEVYSSIMKREQKGEPCLTP